MSTYRYASRGYDPYSYDYGTSYDPYYNYNASSYRRTPGYYTTRDGRWPATGASYRTYDQPTKSSAARQGIYDHRGWYSDSDYQRKNTANNEDYYQYWRRPTTSRTTRPGYYSNANVWDIMNHHRDYYRGASPSRSTGAGVFYDYHGRAHRKLDGKLPPLY